jgi:hypothetical protein
MAILLLGYVLVFVGVFNMFSPQAVFVVYFFGGTLCSRKL